MVAFLAARIAVFWASAQFLLHVNRNSVLAEEFGLIGIRRLNGSHIRSRTAHALERSLRHALLNNATCSTFTHALKLYEKTSSDHLWSDITEVVRHGSTLDAKINMVQWMSHKCESSVWRRFVELAPHPSCQVRVRPSQLSTSACVGVRTCVQRQAKNASYTPHIAIMMGATTKRVAAPSTNNMALFTVSLPSIAKTVECGFRYTVFVGYDAGDVFFDSPAGVKTLKTWFQHHVRNPLQRGGVDIELVPVRVDNPTSKPGPVFNAVALRAQSAAADFFYRINDDTLLLTPWAGAFACTLCSLGPPYGVVGPVESVRRDILTHDFVHAMHLDIFGEYYPTNLTDWWLDDWISKVYGPARSYRLAEVKVRVV